MVKKISLLVTALWLLITTASAQTSMRVPYGSFEQWTTNPGYSLSAGFFNVDIYTSYSTPTGWGFLGYPINESFELFGSNVNLNTTLPLVKVSQETGMVPDSSYAVKMQSFMLSDVVETLPYMLLSANLDSSLTQMVFPTVLATGEVNLDYFLSIADLLMENMDSAETLITSLDTLDVNNLITGGIALNGFEPTRLTGNYKYHSAVMGDNGGVVMLGTRYDTINQRRTVVGGGATISLTDVTGYTPFTVYYQSAHELDASLPELAPDSMIVLLISSASINRQQGSYMCIDNLMFWHDTVEAPDTCAAILGMEVVTIDTVPVGYVLEWMGSYEPDMWELQYGEEGFSLDSGTVMMLQSNELDLSLLGLSPETTYEFYLRSMCNGFIYGDWSHVAFTTPADPCADVVNLQVEELQLDSLNLVDYHMSWSAFSDSWYGPSVPEAWEISYYPTHTPEYVVDTVVYDTFFLFPTAELLPRVDYSCQVRAVCGEDYYGEWAYTTFNTNALPIEGIEDVNALSCAVYPNPAQGRCTVSLENGTTAELRLYSLDGRLLQALSSNGGDVTLSLPQAGIYMLQVVTPQGMTVKKIVNE